MQKSLIHSSRMTECVKILFPTVPTVKVVTHATQAALIFFLKVSQVLEYNYKAMRLSLCQGNCWPLS
jgi:hypothetical protein